ncbi:hypothetical protein D3C75_1266410 [compost metagenome]
MYFVRVNRSGVELVHPSKLRLDACDQLKRVERFGYVVVGADTEACYFINILTFSREHDDGNRIRFSYFHTSLQSVHLGHHQIKYN